MFFLRKAIIIIVVIDALLSLSGGDRDWFFRAEKKNYFKFFPFGGIRKWGAALFSLDRLHHPGAVFLLLSSLLPTHASLFFLSKMEDNGK